MLPPLTTSAQAEGAIEGVYTDYQLHNALSTEFVFSKFRLTAVPTKGLGAIGKRTASTTEWDGKRWVAKTPKPEVQTIGVFATPLEAELRLIGR